ncbi:MAG: SDR family oxidoreductase [Bacteroidales bacterium]|jgi:short-subunit dehydrogenase|nr:SDR family oxidoreductase [Bacteroidales bacterium]
MNIVINGGTRGIGKEMVLLLSHDKNNNLFVTGRNNKILQQLSEEAEHRNIFTFEIDISIFEVLEKQFIETLSGYFQSVDILINNAGTIINKDFVDFNKDEAIKIIETNFLGPAALIRALKPMLIRGSHIVNISSMGGYQGSSKYRGLSYYSASKAALACLSECLAEEFREDGIIVNCIAPGSVQTEMFEEAFPGYKAPVTAREMAEFIAWFAIKGSKFFNGKVIPVALNNP